MKFPKFICDSHLKTIKSLSERRNNYVHYKYEPQQIDFEEDEYLQNEWLKINNDINKAVSYSKEYRGKLIWKS